RDDGPLALQLPRFALVRIDGVRNVCRGHGARTHSGLFGRRQYRLAKQKSDRARPIARRPAAGGTRSSDFSERTPIRHGHVVSGAGCREPKFTAMGGRSAESAERTRAFRAAVATDVVELLAARTSRLHALQRSDVHYPKRKRGGDSQKPKQR